MTIVDYASPAEMAEALQCPLSVAAIAWRYSPTPLMRAVRRLGHLRVRYSPETRPGAASGITWTNWLLSPAPGAPMVPATEGHILEAAATLGVLECEAAE